MTLIECFTQSHIDNVEACLRMRPEQMVIIGNASKMNGPIKRYKELLKKRGIATKVTVCDVQNMDFDDMFAALKKVVLAAQDCVFDLTGGDECVIMAVGAVLAVLPIAVRQRVRVEKYDHNTQTVQDCIHDNRRTQIKPVNLTIEELIGLYGGTLHPKTYQPPENTSSQDLANLWELVSEGPKEWNRAIAYLSEFESRSDSKMHIFLPLSQLRNSVADFAMKETVVCELLGNLHKKGVIENKSSGKVLEYTYKSPMFRYCTQKAGNVLEMKTLLEARAILENGAPYFHDCQMSVSMDWDDETNEPGKHMSETRNEIDVVLMRGTIPLFVSCKNGKIEEVEPYKLHTVAERFGGSYVKKMLIATGLEQKDAGSSSAFTNRAENMDITMVERAAKLSKEGWQNAFKEAMQQRR